MHSAREHLWVSSKSTEQRADPFRDKNIQVSCMTSADAAVLCQYFLCQSYLIDFKPLEQLRMVALQPVVFLAILSSCLAAKLAMFPMFGRSHFMFVARLGQELAERGHEVCKLRILTRQLVIDSSNNLKLNTVEAKRREIFH